VGTDYLAFCAGEGLEACADAFLSWMKEMTEKFPQVIFEGCSSGGMRMDYKTLSVYALLSTSDQVDYLQYPYIAGNILAAVIPEQAAVWSYPVGACTSEEINDDQIVMNMINSFLGRMHLASHLERMNDHQLDLVREGVAFYETLNEVRKRGLPILPWGFTRFGAKQVCAGLRDGSAVYLAVWCLGEELFADIPLPSEIVQAKITYPSAPAADLSHQDNRLCVTFDRPNTAVFLEVRLG
jgi:alpha-galactosidase